jgi:hypothetical protein
MAQQGYELLPEEQKLLGDVLDMEALTKPIPGTGRGLEYFRQLLGMKPRSPEEAYPDLREKLGLYEDEQGGITSLPMDEASRMARAGEQGFNVDMPLYHGTNTDIQEFAIRKKSTGEFGPAVYLTNLPEEAGEYAGTHDLDKNSTESRNIVPVYARLKNPMRIRSPNEFWDRYKGKTDAKAVEAAKADGFDGIIIERPYKIWDDTSNSLIDTGEISAHYVVFDPKNVRSRFAEFDPAQSESPEISKAAGGFIDKPLYGRA